MINGFRALFGRRTLDLAWAMDKPFKFEPGHYLIQVSVDVVKKSELKILADQFAKEGIFLHWSYSYGRHYGLEPIAIQITPRERQPKK